MGGVESGGQILHECLDALPTVMSEFYQFMGELVI